MLRGCWLKIWASLIIAASPLSCLARSIIWSAAFCCSHGPAAARRVVNAVTERGLHCAPPPALFYKRPSPIGISTILSSSTIKNTHASGLPLLSGIRDNLSDTLAVSRCSLCTGKGKSEQEDLGNAEHRQEHKRRWTVKQASRLERRKRVERRPRRERQKEREKAR